MPRQVTSRTGLPQILISQVGGSSSVGLGTFTANANLWQSSATGVVAVELGIPVYDDRTIGGVDTNGAPLQPTYTYVTAT